MSTSDTIHLEDILTGLNNYKIWKVCILAKLQAEKVFGVTIVTNQKPVLSSSTVATVSDVCCTRSARHGTLFPFSLLTVNLRLRADGRCRAVQARLCHKCCRHVISLGPYLLSMTSSPSALVAVLGFSSFHFRFAPSDKRTFCHSSLVTLYLAPLSPLDDNGSIAWSVCVPVPYIKPNTWPGKLQSSLLGYFPGLYETATGDTNMPSRHSHAARSLLLLLSLSPHPASALGGLHR